MLFVLLVRECPHIYIFYLLKKKKNETRSISEYFPRNNKRLHSDKINMVRSKNF